MSKNYWEVLELPINATSDQIKKAYRKKALEFHPDKNKSVDAERKFIEITEAYNYLTSGKHRVLGQSTEYNKWKAKSEEEAKRKFRKERDEFIKEKREKDSELNFKIRIGVVVFFIIFIISVFINPQIGYLFFFVALAIGFIASVFNAVKNR